MEDDDPNHNPAFRVVHEYDFFSEASNKLKALHILPLPQNPDALREFFVPELASPDQDQEPARPMFHQIGINGELAPAVFLFDNNTMGNRINQEPVLFDATIVEEIRNNRETAPVLVLEKELVWRDVVDWYDQLHINNTVKLLEFLTQEERTKVVQEDAGAVDVMIRHGKSRRVLHLAKDMLHDGALALKDGWRDFVQDNKLVRGDVVQGWGYRLLRNQFVLALRIIKKRNAFF